MIARTLPDLFVRQATAHTCRPLFYVKRQGKYEPISWDQVLLDVSAFATWLLCQQIQSGARVLLLSENRPEWAVADIAIQSIGGWTVPVYPTLTLETLQLISRNAQPVIAVASTLEQVAKCRTLRAQIPALQHVVVLEALPSLEQGEWLWADVLAQGRTELPRFREILEKRRQAVQSDDVATLIYTSGTTGDPKGVMLSHRNFLSNVEACLQVLPITRDHHHLSFLPLSHVFERMAGWYLMLAVGATIGYAETMDSVAQDIREFRPTLLLGVPRFFEKLYARIQEHIHQLPDPKRRIAEWAQRIGREAARFSLEGRSVPLGLRCRRKLVERLVFSPLKARLGGRLRWCVSGSAPLSKELGEFFYSIGLTILEGYGLTETSPVITVNPLPIPRFGSVGKVLPGVEVKIAEDGEILTRGPHVMRGYYQKPEETAAVVIDGWFHTGDIGHLDGEGFLWITDRKKDLIKTAGGKFVAPQKLENRFVLDPYVSQAFVFGDLKPYCVALIVPNKEQLRRYVEEQEICVSLDAELLKDPRVQAFYWERIQERQKDLPRFEQVKRIALLDQEFTQGAGELTPTLKAKRKVIAQRYATLLQSLYDCV